MINPPYGRGQRDHRAVGAAMITLSAEMSAS